MKLRFDANSVSSFFGEQEGDFELHLFAISAFKHVPYATEKNHNDEEDDLKAVTPASEKDAGNKTWWRSLLCGLV